jgi:ComF family protein
MVSRSFRSLIDGALELLFPDRCVGCGQPGQLLCDSCVARIRPYPDKRVQRVTYGTLGEVHAACLFESPLREAIHALKYDKAERIAPVLATLLATHMRQARLPVDAVIPVPLHPNRLQERGFNQSELLAQGLAETCNLRLLRRGLVRQRDTAHQVKLDAHARLTNMQGAFVWRSKKAPPRRILLIDDVLTTGATLAACADTLQAAGAKEIRALALAHSL